MLGAIAGDIIGSIYEVVPMKRKDFKLFSFNSHFSDDTVLTYAVAKSLLTGTSYTGNFKKCFWCYPLAGFGQRFTCWAMSNRKEGYNSWGNGAAMRVSPIAWAYDNLEDVLKEAERCTAATHNHPEGIKGGQATAVAIFLARQGKTKAEIRDYIEQTFHYNLHRTIDEIRPNYKFEVSCQKSVPEAIIAFLESTDFEDAIRNAVSLGGDSDTIACITGSIAEAFYGGVPEAIAKPVWKKLDRQIRHTVLEFGKVYQLPYNKM
ncbi:MULTISPECIES: ADP-ribosylglycohydrolase family protein [Pseudanabaena]|uniref:ADP-ribosylation/Crystallin J1 n=2 Tax=Pseudanabaena TaxID=1152 RepID=L8N382_9CYAN|nr:ADP-ribosylglycohydrolase family protein [Pseudanabaena catenata]ELS33549.1 ADP-ribosylation/Crystallin J1 [Pseudanabaena biceps PCC 7429]MDG3494252.1 ADP-ribosylglycohydrolase family protein [Pseudanabaena catenata USMAC16]